MSTINRNSEQNDDDCHCSRRVQYENRDPFLSFLIEKKAILCSGCRENEGEAKKSMKSNIQWRIRVERIRQAQDRGACAERIYRIEMLEVPDGSMSIRF